MLRAVLTRAASAAAARCSAPTLRDWRGAAAAAAALAAGAATAACEAQPQQQPFHSQAPRCLPPTFLADAAERVAPAVVNITAAVGGVLGQFANVVSSGSGFIISADGVVLTNAHVVAAAAARAGGGAGGGGLSRGRRGASAAASDAPLVLSLHDGRTFVGVVEALDAASDVAIVRVVDPPPPNGPLALPTVALGSSAALRPGEWVVALGSPLHLRNTVTAGIVSCVDRKAAEIGLRGSFVDYIQTDAAINEGSSGGPLVNLDGEVVGISSMKAAGAQGVSFAIPVDAAKEVVASLRAHGRVVRPYLGVRLMELSPAVAAQMRERDPAFPAAAKRGVLVPGVVPGSPAARGGLRHGDVITAWGGRAVDSTRALLAALGESVGVACHVTVLRPGPRGGQQLTLIITAEEAEPLP